MKNNVKLKKKTKLQRYFSKEFRRINYEKYIYTTSGSGAEAMKSFTYIL